MADVAKLIEKADESAGKRNYDYAIELYLQALTLDPDHAPARKALRAVELKREREMGGTPKALAIVLNLPSQVAASFFGLTKNFEKQALQLEGVLQREPRNTASAMKLGRALYRAGSKKSARAVFEAIPDWNPGFAPALKAAGAIARELGDHAGALSLYQRAKAVSPQDKEASDAIRDISATVSIGVREQASSYREVMKDAGAAVDLEKRQKIAAGETDLAESAARLEKELAGKPGDLPLLRRLARVYEQQKASGKAVETYKRILRIEPGDFDAETRVAEIQLTDFDNRIQKLRALLRADPSNAQAKGELTQVTAERRTFAVNDLKSRVAAHPTELELRFRLGIAFHEAGRVEEATAEFQQTKKDPMRARASAYWLGRCFADLGKVPLAVKQLQAALEGVQKLDDLAKETHYALGQALLAQKDDAGARQHFERIYEEDIGFRDVAQILEGRK